MDDNEDMIEVELSRDQAQAVKEAIDGIACYEDTRGNDARADDLTRAYMRLDSALEGDDQ